VDIVDGMAQDRVQWRTLVEYWRKLEKEFSPNFDDLSQRNLYAT